MKKYLRIIFSPTLAVVLILLLEITSMVLLEFAFESISQSGNELGLFFKEYEHAISIFNLTFDIVFALISIFTFFKILNRKSMAPEFKIPWLVLVFIFPLTTSTFYWIFAHPYLHKKDKKILEASEENFEKNFALTKLERYAFSDIDTNYQSSLKYLRRATGLKATTGNKTTYYKSGEYFFPDLVKNLKEAEKFIFIEFYIISEGKWWNQIEEILIQKAQQGVEVRVIFDDFGSLGLVSSHLPQKLEKYGIKMRKFHPFKPILSSHLNNRDHRKIVVIDHKYAYTGGNNIGDEYANDEERFGYWKDTMVRIQGPAINNLIAIFLQNYDFTTYVPSDYDKYLVHDYETYEEDGYLFPFGVCPGALQKENVAEQNFLNIINSANKQIYISSPYLIPTNSLIESLRNAALRGVEVNLILPAIPDKKIVYWMAKSHFQYLLKAGVRIYTYTPGFNHEKQVLADDHIAFIGTINFDYRSLVHNFECGVTLIDSPIIKDMKADFEEMVAQSQLVGKDFKMRAIERFLCSLLEIFSTMF